MDKMYEENEIIVIILLIEMRNIWGICLSLLIFVYENFMYDIIVYLCF